MSGKQRNLILTALSVVLLSWAYPAAAQEIEGRGSMFVDSYLAFSSLRNTFEDRPYSTQAVRQEQPRVNLVSGRYDLRVNNVRGVLALQAGDSVRVNYANEPHQGVRYLQEAYLGYDVSPTIAVDAGIFFSHIGAESWLSKDNILYTRSLTAEYSPYYEEGIRSTFQVGKDITARALVLNGWQNISDTAHPAFGSHIEWRAVERVKLFHCSFIGEESGGLRVFNDFIASATLDSGYSLIASFDVGTQERDVNGDATWTGYTVMVSKTLSDSVTINARVEQFNDPSQVVARTETGDPFRLRGVSLGVGYAVADGLVLRGEVKHLWSRDEVFRDGSSFSSHETLFVVSFSYFIESPVS